MVRAFIDYVGSRTLDACTFAGGFFLFLLRSCRIALSTPLKLKMFFSHVSTMGVDSLPIVMLTGSSTGMVFTLQSYIGFQRFGGEQFIGTVVALGMIRELGPVLTGLMVTGRVGSAITAEIGTMAITEQIDALITLRINPFQYLVIPRILAGVIVLPCLALFAMICGILGGDIVNTYILGLGSEDYINSIRNAVELHDIVGGLVKSAFFGLILSWVGTYKGMRTEGGARGVGRSTIQSVVLSSIMILISNYFLTKFLERL